jgi:hypothetical protein
MRGTEFMLQLIQNLVKDRQITESSANQYVQTLYSLHGKTPFSNLSWLKNTAEIDEKLATFAPSTQKGYTTAIVSVLSLFKDKPSFKKTYNHYHEKMMNSEKEEDKPAGKTKKQEDNWLTWEEVQNKKNELREAVLKFATNKHISPSQYDTLLRYVVLSLYTDVPPRRNQDFMDMYVVKKYSDDLPTDKNYLDNVNNPHQMIFNKYKTAKTYGQQKVDVPNTSSQPLGDALLLLLRHHPLRSQKTKEFKLLVAHDGSALNSVNAITRLLNKIFGKKVGSSLLRHIYITSKYGDVKDEQEKDAQMMGHSVREQQDTYNNPS